MATYKVIQDIEAEDKLLGPLTFRQFIYAGSCVIFLYLCFLSITKGAPFLVIVFLPFAGVSGFFAWPWSRDQPTEIWALARIRFLVKPRKRIWNQSGVKELVTVTAPKKVQAVYSNGLSETEVQSRLRALADTIDSRGWAIKNVNVNMYSQPTSTQNVPDSDRLISMANLPQEVPDFEVQASDDIMEDTNPVARQFDTMIAASTKAHREEILEHLQSAGPPPAAQQVNNGITDNGAPAPNYWFLNQPSGGAGASVPTNAVTFNTQVVTPGAPVSALPVVPGQPTPDEEAIVERLRQEELRSQRIDPSSHWHNIQPLSAQQQAAQDQAQAQAQQTQMPEQQPYQYPPAGQQMPQQMPVQQTAQMPYTPQQQPMQNGYAPAWPTPVMPGQYQAAPGQQIPGQQQPRIDQQTTQQQQVTQAPDPAILQLASNDDLDVATLARQANKHKEELLQNEVVISLH
ncbi:MAG: PrgI family protein [Candidatus Saccharibacteria bacterium]